MSRPQKRLQVRPVGLTIKSRPVSKEVKIKQALKDSKERSLKKKELKIRKSQSDGYRKKTTKVRKEGLEKREINPTTKRSPDFKIKTIPRDPIHRKSLYNLKKHQSELRERTKKSKRNI
jgi:hypothetical protein